MQPQIPQLPIIDIPAIAHSINEKGEIVGISPKWTEAFGYEWEEVIGRKSIEFLTPASKLKAKGVLKKFRDTGKCEGIYYQFIRKDGEIRDIVLDAKLVQTDAGPRSYACMVDITEQIQAQKRLQVVAFTDDLTGLLNRRGFFDEVSKLNTFTGSLTYLDLDGFKLVNDTAGHNAGDQILLLFADTLRHHLGKNSLICRPSGDEFLVLSSIPLTDLKQSLAQLIKEFSGHRKVKGRTDRAVAVKLGVSAGCCHFQKVNLSELIDDLIIKSESGMANAKARGKDQVFYLELDEHHVFDAQKKNRWVERIRAAIEGTSSELIGIDCQSIQPLDQDSQPSCEVLARLVTGTERISAGKWIDFITDSSDLMVALDRRVMIELFTQLSQTRSCKYEAYSINLSAASLCRFETVEFIKTHLNSFKIRPSCIKFEVTEQSVFQQNTDEVVRQIQALGCKVVLDDFGFANCGIQVLDMLPVDAIKIDGSYMRRVLTDQKARYLIEGMLFLAGKLDISITAEYVSSQAVLDELLVIARHLQKTQGFKLDLSGQGHQIDRAHPCFPTS